MNEELVEAIEDLKETQQELTEQLGRVVELLLGWSQAHDTRDDERDDILEDIRNEIRGLREDQTQA